MSRTWVEVNRDPRAGRVRLTFGSDGPRGRGHLGVRVLTSTAECARLALVAEGALLVAGDDVRVDLRVGPGCLLEVVEPAGTVAYDMRGGEARWAAAVDLKEAARMVWRAEPFVVSSGARVHRTVDVALGGEAVAVLRETLVLGRAGESGGVLKTRLRVDAAEGPLLAEDLDVDGAAPRLGVLGSSRVVDTMTVLGRRATGIPTPDGSHRLELDGEGTLLRAMVQAVHLSPLDRAWCSTAALVGEPRRVGLAEVT